MKHTFEELKQWQSLPLSVKVLMTKARIREWIKTYGEDGVYISFSGGKDSTVLLDLVRQDYPNVPALFVDVPTQYPELREFATSFENVEVIRPNKTFMQVCEKYGFPLISKEASECIEGAKRYLTELIDNGTVLTDRQTEPPYRYFYEKLTGTGKYSKFSDSLSIAKGSRGGADNKYRKLRGIGEFSKRQNQRKKGRLQSEVGSDVGAIHERQEESDKGDYP